MSVELSDTSDEADQAPVIVARTVEAEGNNDVAAFDQAVSPGEGDFSVDSSQAKEVKLFVGQIPSTVTSDDLISLFGNFPIKSARIIYDRTTQAHKNCGFIFVDQQYVEPIIEAYHNRVTLDGMKNSMQVKYAEQRNSNPRFKRLSNGAEKGPYRENSFKKNYRNRGSNPHYGDGEEKSYRREPREPREPRQESRSYGRNRNYDKSPRREKRYEDATNEEAAEPREYPNYAAEATPSPVYSNAVYPVPANYYAKAPMNSPGYYADYAVQPQYPNYQGYVTNMMPSPVNPSMRKNEESYVPSMYSPVPNGMIYVNQGMYPGGYPMEYVMPNQMPMMNGSEYQRYPSQRYSSIPPDCTLFVYSIPSTFTDNELFDLFKDYGSIAQARVIIDRATGRSKGYGFVSYHNSADARAAIEGRNGFVVQGRQLKVDIKKAKEM